MSAELVRPTSSYNPDIMSSYPDEFADFDMNDLRTWEIDMNILGSYAMNGTNLNETNTILKDDHNVIHQLWVYIIFAALYGILFISGISGNFLVSFVVIRNKAMHTVTNCFIASLAVNDMVIALTVPLTPLYSFLEGWYFGSFMCHFCALVQAASLFISTLTLTAIAVERFFVIVFPYLPKLSTKMALLVICSIWILSLSICTPYAVYMKYLPVSLQEGRSTPRCDEEWPSQRGRRTFGTVALIVQYSLPLIVITSSYVCIWLKLRSQAAKGLTNSKRGRASTALIRKRRTNRMLIAMVIIFGLCWLPLNLVNILNDYWQNTVSRWEYFVLVFCFAHVLAISSTCYNPFLYAWMNENFRKEFTAVLPCFTTPATGIRGRQTTFINEKFHYDDAVIDRAGNGTLDPESTYLTTHSPKLPKNIVVTNGSTVKRPYPGQPLPTDGLLQPPSYTVLHTQQQDRNDEIHDV